MVTSLELDPDAVGALARQGATIVSKGSWSAQTLLELLPRGTGARTRGLTEA